MYINSGGTWKKINDIYINVSGTWKKILNGYINVSGTWKSFFTTISNEPTIAQQVELTTSSSSMPATLTGTNYRWTNATTLTYKFQYYNGSQWLNGNGSNASGTITNPSVGSSNTKTYTPVLADFPSSSSTSTGQFRFVVTATNTNVSPSITSDSVSDTVSIQNIIDPAPVNQVAPSLTQVSGSNMSVTSGTWTNSPTQYRYQWRDVDNPTILRNVLTSSTSDSYTGTIGFYYIVTVTAYNASNSGTASSNILYLQSIPTITTPTYSNITSATGTINWTSTNQSSFALNGSFTDTGTTATSVAKTGLSANTTYSGNIIITSSTGNTASVPYSFTTSVATVPPSGGSAFVSPSSGTAGSTTYTGSTSGWSGTAPISFAYSWKYINLLDQAIEVATGTTFSPASNFNSVYPNQGTLFNVTASNSAGSATASTFFTINNPAPSGTAPSAPTSVTAAYSSGPSWACRFNRSSSGTTPITYSWSFYVASNSSGSNQTLVSSNSFSSSVYNTTFNIGTLGNGGTGYVWGKLVVTASNSFGSATADSGWN